MEARGPPRRSRRLKVILSDLRDRLPARCHGTLRSLVHGVDSQEQVVGTRWSEHTLQPPREAQLCGSRDSGGNRIGNLHDLGCTTVGDRQSDDRGAAIALRERCDQRRIGAGKAVDRLGRITDGTQLPPIAQPQVQQPLLQRPPRRRRRSGSAPSQSRPSPGRERRARQQVVVVVVVAAPRGERRSRCTDTASQTRRTTTTS